MANGSIGQNFKLKKKEQREFIRRLGLWADFEGVVPHQKSTEQGLTHFSDLITETTKHIHHLLFPDDPLL
jgi:hypothetical protein